MSIALDVGAYRFESLRRTGDRLLGRSCRAAYSAVPTTDSQCRLFQQAQVPYAVCDDSLVLMGDWAVDLAHLFQIRSCPLLPDGGIPQDDPLARQVIAALAEALLPEPSCPDEICCLVLPSAHAGQDNSAGKGADWEFFARLARLRGYQPVSYGSAMALILAELVAESFTGIGIVCGASHCDLTVAHRGVELCRCSIPQGGDWIDERLASEADTYGWEANGERFLDTEHARQRKEGFSGSLLDPQNSHEALLTDSYSEMATRLVKEAARCLANGVRPLNVPQPLTVVCGGGTARTAGFREVLAKAFQTTTFPLQIGNIRMSAGNHYTVARGGLICAELEAGTRSGQGAAA